MNCIHCQSGIARQIGETRYETRYFCTACRRNFEIPKPQPPEIRNNRFFCFDHQNKADALIGALSGRYEHFQPQALDEAPVLFTLSDSDVSGRVNQMRVLQRTGCNRFFVYPHAARPSLINDLYPAWEYVTAQFVVNDYHAEVLRAYGYNKPLACTGWYLCGLRPFHPRERAYNVLFAPIHPRNAPQDRDANVRTFERLYPLALKKKIHLTVRYVGDLDANGLTEMPGVTYVNGGMNKSERRMESIDAADVVVGHQTFAWLAVARGTPTVMFAEDMPTHFRRIDQSYCDVKSWKKVLPLFRYPLDILNESDTMALLNRAVQSDDEISDWRRRMIGDAFDSERFTGALESFL